WRFTGLVLAVYLALNIVFAMLYMAVGLEHLEGTVGETALMQWLDAFFFSAQTVTTLGYGRISPVGTPASVVAAIESLVGLLSFALATGLLYGRFSRPDARIKFSANALVAPYRDITGFMFRIVNERSSQLIEVEVEVLVSYVIPGTNRRRFETLSLELSKINFFTTSWTVVHPIKEESPLYGVDEAMLIAMEAEFVILLKGFEDTFSSQVYHRSSYTCDEVRFNAKFNPMVETSNDDYLGVELTKMGDYEFLGE
ncbi:MAG: ion channel, partial [Bacteroidota bacterium]